MDDRVMAEAEQLLVLAQSCLNELESQRVTGLEKLKVRTTYNLASLIDEYFRKNFNRNAHECTETALNELVAKRKRT